MNGSTCSKYSDLSVLFLGCICFIGEKKLEGWQKWRVHNYPPPPPNLSGGLRGINLVTFNTWLPSLNHEQNVELNNN